MNYNPTGTVASIRDFNGKTTNFAYDVLNRLATRTPDVSFGEPAVSYTYTPAGQRLSMTDASGTASYGYDNQNRLVTKTTPVGKLTYTYDAAGNRQTVTSSNTGGTSVAYSYDGLNRLSTVSDHGQTQATYTYDVVGNLGGMVLGNGAPLQPQYDAMYRLTSLTMQATQFSKVYSYTYGPVGNRLSSSDSNGRQVNYSYDSIYRLTQEAIATSGGGVNGASTYNLDAVGNRLTRLSNLPGIGAQTPTYDANDRTVGNSYDANGNTLAAGARTFGYDSFDRLTKFNGGAVGIVYDGDGTRVAKTSGGVTTQYLVDDLNPTGLTQVAEEVVGGVVQRRYVYGLQRVTQTQGGVTSYYGYDGHNDVRFLMSAAGAVTDTYDYDAFGNLISGTGTTANVYRSQGEALDSETGLYYLRARYYDPGMGRFLAVDPLADQGEHPYSYASADPVNGHDPTGQDTVIVDALLTAAFALPLVPPTLGAREAVHCLMNVVMSIVATPGRLIQSVAACEVAAAQPSRGGGGGGGQGGGQPPCEDSGKKEAMDDLKQIASGEFRNKRPCMAALSGLRYGGGVMRNPMNGTQVADAVMAAAKSAIVEDGPSSTDPLTPGDYPNTNVPGTGPQTVGAWFGHFNSAEGLSQATGPKIFLRLKEWGCNETKFKGTYGLGTLMHELLHKNSCGGSDHPNMRGGLELPAMNVGQSNDISARLGKRCF